ncbi:phage holin family protein [Anaerosinus massiliensis]|uniref:phage holin family protein n=1 Tax=Massilibacillus massiliensis TaxID=1806837 RepID=UPI0018FE6BEE|nr:phage holin family protein [Massilibacillus massiliensis]
MNTFTQSLLEMYKFLIELYTAAEIKIIALSGVLGMLAAKMIGGFDIQIKMLLFFVALDYATGLYAAYKTDQVSSYKSFRGIFKKATIFAVVAFCYGIDLMMNMTTLRYFAICGYGVMEIISIVENADRGGWGNVFPAFIRDKFVQIRTERKL